MFRQTHTHTRLANDQRLVISILFRSRRRTRRGDSVLFHGSKHEGTSPLLVLRLVLSGTQHKLWPNDLLKLFLRHETLCHGLRRSTWSPLLVRLLRAAATLSYRVGVRMVASMSDSFKILLIVSLLPRSDHTVLGEGSGAVCQELIDWRRFLIKTA